MARKSQLRGYLYIAGATLCWGISASLGRAAFTGRLPIGHALAPIDPLILAQCRTTISFIILAPIYFLFRRKELLRVSPADMGRAMLVGIAGIAGSNYFYYLAIQRTNVGASIVLQYTAPLWVLLWMVLRGHQQMTYQRAISVAMALLGICLVIGLFGGGFRLDPIGLIAAEAAGLSFAFYNIYSGDLLETHGRCKVLVMALFGTTVFWLLINPPWKVSQAHYSAEQWVFLTVFAITSILIPYSLYFQGLTHLDPTRAIVTSCLEPVFSILIAFLFLGELLGPMQVLGIGLVLFATVFVQVQAKDEKFRIQVEPVD